MNMKFKDDISVVIKLPKEHFNMYSEYLKVIKKNGSSVMGRNLQILLKGLEETLEESTGKKKKR